MKRFLPLVILPLCLSPLLFSPGQARAEELPYNELIAKAENYLIPDEKKIVYEGAAIVLFHRAAKAAPDEGKKLEALLRAGYAEELMKQYPSAIESYEEALALQNPSTGQKQRAQLALALAKYQFLKQKNRQNSSEAEEINKTLEANLLQGTLPVESQMKAREVIAEIHASRLRPLPAVQQYRNILELPGLTAQVRGNYLALALAELGKATPSPEALALLNQLAPQHLALQTKPDDIAQAKLRWAGALQSQNALPAALAKYTEIANDGTLQVSQRTTALSNIIALHNKQKNYPAALSAADRWAVINTTPYGQFRKYQERAKIFQEQKKEPELRAQWQAFIKLPLATPAEKRTAWDGIATSYHREHEANSTNAVLAEAEKSAYLSIWKLEGIPPKQRIDAFLNGIQTEVEAGATQTAINSLLAGVKDVETFQVNAQEKQYLRQSIHLGLTQLYRATKQFAAATAALILAQGDAQWGDNRPGEQIIVVFQEAVAAADWPAARTSLLALRNVWNAAPKQYFYNLAQVEIKAKDWNAAKVALDEFDKLLPTAAEKKDADLLRAMLPN